MTNILTNIVSGPAGQEAQQQNEWLQLLIRALPVATFAAGYFTHWLTTRRDARNRLRRGKDDYIGALARWESQIPQRADDCKRLRDESVAPISAAIHTARTFVGDAAFARLSATLSEYQQIPDAQLDYGLSNVLNCVEGLDPKYRTTPCDELLRDYFRRFREEVDHAP